MKTFGAPGKVATVSSRRSRPSASAISAGLPPVDVAIMDLAEKVALHAYKVTEDDVERLRGFGLGDAEIFDVVLAAAARAFFSKSLDSMGAEADEAYATTLGPGVAAELAVGRPFPMTMRPVE